MRTRTATIAGTTVLIAALLPVAASAQPQARPAAARPAAHHPASSWTMGGYDAAQTSYNANEHSLTAANARHLTKKWSHRNYGIPGASAIAGSSVYAQVEGGIERYAVANGHGQRKYRIGLKSLTPGGPTIDGSHMIIDVAGTLESVKLSNGRATWKIHKHTTPAVGYEWSSIVASGSTLYAILTETDFGTGTAATSVKAIKASNGHVKWTVKSARGPIAAGGGRVYVTTTTGNYDSVESLKASTGRHEWTFPISAMTFGADYAVTPSAVIAATGGGSPTGSDVYALSPATGKVIWTHSDDGEAASPGGNNVVIDGSSVLYTSSNGHVVALRLSNGRLLWRTAAFGAELIGGGGVVYTRDSTQHDIALRISDGKVLWRSKPTNFLPYLVGGGRLLTLYPYGSDQQSRLVAYGS